MNINDQIEKFNTMFSCCIDAPEIVVLNSREEIDMLTGKKTGDWLVGWSNGNKIYILAEDKFETESRHPRTDFTKTLNHELLHQYFGKLTGGLDKPAWLNEGFCVYFADQNKNTPADDEKLEIEHYTNYWDNKGYKLAYFWVARLIDKFGVENFVKFIRSMATMSKNNLEGDFRELFKFHFGFYPDRGGAANELGIQI